jgi:hypothetical protein
MTRVTFPIPYEVKAVFKPYRTPRLIGIADEAEFDIRDVLDEEAPVYVSVQAAYHDHRYDLEEKYDDYPRTNLRFFEGSWYAPVLRIGKQSLAAYEKDLMLPGEERVRPLQAGDFHQYYARSPVWATVTDATSHSFKKQETLLRQQQDGSILSLENSKLKQVEDIETPRNEAIAWAKNKLADFISVEGAIYEKMKGEPAFQFWLAGDDKVVLAIHTGRDHSRHNCGYFRLDRLDDCLDHIKTHYGDRRLLTQFADLQVERHVSLAYDDEAIALRGLIGDAMTAMWSISDGLTPELEVLKQELGKLNETTSDLDDIEAWMQRFIQHAPPTAQKREAIIAGLARWEIRPTEASFRI